MPAAPTAPTTRSRRRSATRAARHSAQQQHGSVRSTNRRTASKRPRRRHRRRRDVRRERARRRTDLTDLHPVVLPQRRVHHRHGRAAGDPQRRQALTFLSLEAVRESQLDARLLLLAGFAAIVGRGVGIVRTAGIRCGRRGPIARPASHGQFDFTRNRYPMPAGPRHALSRRITAAALPTLRSRVTTTLVTLTREWLRSVLRHRHRDRHANHAQHVRHQGQRGSRAANPAGR